jgi:hypothetical protein
MTDPQTIVEGMTKGEARAILAAAPRCLGGAVLLVPVYAGRRSDGTRNRISLPTLLSLERKGLVVFHPPRLTAAGFAVRTHLEKESKK